MLGLVIVLLFGCAGDRCDKRVDADGDGASCAEDCDDADPSRWDQVGVYAGRVTWAEVEGFCHGYCELEVVGDVHLSGYEKSWGILEDGERSPEGGFPDARLGMLNCVTAIDGSLGLMNDPTLVNFAGLERLTRVTTGIRLYRNDKLRDLVGLENLVELGALIADYSYKLTSFAGLSGLSSVSSITLEKNPELLSLDGLDTLQSIEGSLFLHDNPMLNDVSALYDLDEVGGDLIVRNHRCLWYKDAIGLVDNIGRDNIDGTVGVFNAQGPC